MSFNFLNNIYTLGLYFIYVTLFSSNIYMLVIYLFYATQKTLCYTKGNIFILCYTKNAIVVPDRCCSQNPTTCTCFFLVCITTWPMSSSDTVSKFKVSQWDHTSSMVGYHDPVSTASSQRDYVSKSTLSHYNLANMCGWRSWSHSSPLSETRHVSGNSLLKNIPSYFMVVIGPMIGSSSLRIECPITPRTQ